MSVAIIQSWLQLAATAATLVALVVGILQLRHVRRTVALQTNLSVMQAERSIWSLALSNPTIAPNLLAERWGDPAGERLFAAMLLDHYEALYFQYRHGAIPRRNFEPIARAMVEHIASPALRQIWESHKDLYWQEFARYLERRLPPPAAH